MPEALLQDRHVGTLCLDHLAQSPGNSHVTLKRSCRREAGMTLFECLRDLRLERAADLIRSNRRSLPEAAYD